MKGKSIRILLALVLVLSFSLVTAVPAGAASTLNVTPYTLDGVNASTSVWSTAQKKTGSSSVLLTHTTEGAGSVYVDFVPLATETLATFQADITAATNDWTFEWSMASAGAVNGPQIELYFDDPDSTGFLEVTAVGLQGVTGSGISTFVKETLASGTLAGYGGWGEAGVSGSFFNWGPLTALSGIEAAVNGESDVTSASDWVLTRVRVELWESTTLAAHIDDIEIAGVTYYGLIQDAIDTAVASDTINVAAGTYSTETTWPIDVDKALTLQGVGVNSIIDPGTAGLGVFEISADNVTIDGFKLIQGTEATSGANPQEHLIWVHAEYSTISDNTILNKGGGTAGIFIGDRTASIPTGTGDTATWGYQVSTPLGHTIQDNIFRNANAGEGWGIYAYDLTDSLIKGNTFAGDSAPQSTPWTWNTSEGAHGTGIVIANATAGLATGSPGGGYVVIEDNTAQYIKYGWLSFVSSYPFNLSATDTGPGSMHEQSLDSTVDKVIVRNNTVSLVEQKPGGASWSTAVKFMGSKQGDGYGVGGAKLTIGSDNVTLTGNQFYDNDGGIEVTGENSYDANGGYDSGYAAVLDADNIVINYNLIYTMDNDGLENAALNNTVSNAGQGPKTVDARYNWWGDIYGPSHAGNPYTGSTSGVSVTNYVDYSSWMIHTVLASGWNIYSPPWAPNTATNTPDEALNIIGTDSANVASAYYFDSSAATPVWAVATSLTPLTAIYLDMTAAATIDVAFSQSYTAPPSRTMYQGWNLIGPAAYASMDVDEAIGDAYWGTGEANLVGWSHVESLAINQTATWTHLRGATIYAGASDNVLPTEGYWVYMVNQGTLGGFTYTPIAITTE